MDGMVGSTPSLSTPGRLVKGKIVDGIEDWHLSARGSQKVYVTRIRVPLRGG